MFGSVPSFELILVRTRCISGIHPAFQIETKFGNHHPGFTEFSGKPQNFAVARVAAKALAGTSIDMLSVDGLVDQAKAAFEEQKGSWTMWEPNYV